MTKSQFDKELEVMTYGMFTFYYAMELLTMHTSKIKPKNLFRGEDKKWWDTFQKGIETAKFGIGKLTQNFATDFANVNAATHTDDIRRDANLIIRTYIDSRNYIHTKEDAEKWDNALLMMSGKKKPLVRKETRDKFILK